ncbi:MAG: FG-GAP-like repeat-containing protein, partial [Bacteroidota bacterium]
ANRVGNNLTILKNNGNGTFAARLPVEANGGQETACAAADANGDGILDLFVGAYSSNEIILMLGNGTGGLTFSAKVPAGGKPWKITAGDVNGDGKVDVVSANSFNNNASVILGNGAGGLSPAVTYPTGAFDLAIALGDIDGDGDLDMVTSNYAGRNWTVYENNGTGIFINQRTLLAASAGSCATLHDRDNDGDLDMTGIDEEDDLVFLFDNRPPTGVGEGETLPFETRLFQNYPNPFNPSTTIQYSLPSLSFNQAKGRAGEGSHVTLKVYDLFGREVATLVNGQLGAGSHEVTWDGAGVASGVYFYRLQAGHLVETRKLMLLR